MPTAIARPGGRGPALPRRALLVALPALAAAPTAAEGLAAPGAIIAALRRGGLNIYLRHAITDRSQIDTGRRGDQAGQRNLSEAGRRQATALGAAFVRLGIPVGEVFASEVFRARDTAELAFGAAQVRILEELIADDYTPRDPLADATAVRRRLGRRPASGNDVFVGHIVPFGMVLGRALSQAGFPEGALGVVAPRGDGFDLLGILAAAALIDGG